MGCCIKGISPVKIIAAGKDAYGVYQPSIEELVKQIKSLRGKYDKLIVMPHWGEEHILLPPYKCVAYAQKMIDAGADAIFGSHSHCVSSNIYYKGKPIFFGLGNFLYPDVCLQPPRPFYYPESVEELKAMQCCINYPKSVSLNTILVWSEDSRVGIAAEATIEQQKIIVRRKLVRMGDDNILRFLKDDSKVRNTILGHIRIPFANLLTSPIVYKPFHSIIWKFATKIGMRGLGDFRKDV